MRLRPARPAPSRPARPSDALPYVALSLLFVGAGLAFKSPFSTMTQRKREHRQCPGSLWQRHGAEGGI